MNIADLSFNDVALLADTLVGGISVYEDEHGRVIRIPEDLTNFPTHPRPKPTPYPHPRPWPRPRPGHPPIYAY
jgi:hypothetical protein